MVMKFGIQAQAGAASGCGVRYLVGMDLFDTMGPFGDGRNNIWSGGFVICGGRSERFMGVENL